MSKEREFIRLWYENIELWKFHAEELLAQPEQTKQEPMAWVWGVFNPHTGDWCDGCVAKDKPLENQDRRNIRALYTTPPKREPLSEDKLDVLAEANITDEGIAGYYLGFRDAEKHHGIGGGEC